MIRYIKRLWNGMDEQDKILTIYLLFLAVLVLVSTT
jgi:energy-converting hydrogenase Eha subunit F